MQARWTLRHSAYLVLRVYVRNLEPIFARSSSKNVRVTGAVVVEWKRSMHLRVIIPRVIFHSQFLSREYSPAGHLEFRMEMSTTTGQDGNPTKSWKKKTGHVVAKLKRPIGKARRTDISRQYLETRVWSDLRIVYPCSRHSCRPCHWLYFVVGRPFIDRLKRERLLKNGRKMQWGWKL